jgi:hypothetical protein
MKTREMRETLMPGSKQRSKTTPADAASPQQNPILPYRCGVLEFRNSLMNEEMFTQRSSVHGSRGLLEEPERPPTLALFVSNNGILLNGQGMAKAALTKPRFAEKSKMARVLPRE